MTYFAVIDTETTWHDKVMSLGVVVADSKKMEPIDSKYYLLVPECKSGGMYSRVLRMPGINDTFTGSRDEAIADLIQWLKDRNVEKILAYNGNFDRGHLPELSCFTWCDIMKIAAYKQYNDKLPENANFCATGRLKSGFGVQPILRLLSCDESYEETHNAYFDAMDELQIVKLLGHGLEVYENAIIGKGLFSNN